MDSVVCVSKQEVRCVLSMFIRRIGRVEVQAVICNDPRLRMAETDE